MVPWFVSDLAHTEMTGKWCKFDICKHDHILSKHRCTARDLYQTVELWRGLGYRVRIDYQRTLGHDMLILPRVVLSHKSILHCEC